MEFEKPLVELYEKIDELKRLTVDSAIDLSAEIEVMEKRSQVLKERIFANLTPTQILQIARHQERPTTLDYINLIFKDFIELKGDRYFANDNAVVGGPAFLDDQPVMVIGIQKGKDTKDNIYRNFGMANPEGYRKAIRLMKMADKFHRPIVTLADTPGAYPGIGAEERGQAEAIARSLKDMAKLEVPFISIITGEGGSGGALGVAMGNIVMLLQYAVYSVISPEGCASILWRDAAMALEAAENLRITAPQLKELGIIDDIIPEPLGGAHNNYEEAAKYVKEYILK
ncbi:MAG: acetyl-CoA carboxylase carboxyltransferase subunit alpha, partial [Candidatus Margulisbacteria bacterium]|nr:acetyl-CoA carboxylase carboxyltransferase subunit alpha [Candidatus Margulisiibacteriota bacterium]